MPNYFSSIEQAAKYSREYDTITFVRMDDWDTALDELISQTKMDEEYDYVENGDTLEFWTYKEGSDEMPMRVHVVKSA